MADDTQAQLQSLHAHMDSYEWVHDMMNYGTALFWFLGYVIIIWKVKKDRSAAGISLQSLFALFLSEFNNVVLQVILAWTYNFSLGLAFWICDVSTSILSFFSWYHIFTKYYSSYEKDRDTFGLKFCRVLPNNLGKKVYAFFLYFVAFVITIPLFIFRRTRLPTLYSLYECFDDTMLALALIPQLYMFYNRRPRRVSSLLGHFVVLLFIARLCALSYWLTYPIFHSGAIPSRGLHICTELFNLLILLDFLYYYLVAAVKGEKDIALPL
uniref:ER lumen protein-retaining receptor n=1 Tax=Chromera velia CCMP2878 TaxID=1169474 RepID=A0A0G4F9T4_9ALVE|mmetsp:Transcript_54010/g.105631  ORF Transcript_54010/g.105631 Transcript_54010/m.105631 type:complete len:268 (-) Transcript_54010:136-939(-)|eukprot:Cvel_15769.t1-p1 / transcript=Cvel_15769.t1 / gene=Cvel_15769 / organism=Chromera_velia_CCMP2878 / gene_product=ER lumen protein retaining receptor, putative / transcript_product=ER lumen protein retaining receptor, putative / location=Cvel_scaffold1182:22825-25322(-) / protein_length=267 / sequence_SO=supercontig / SO=protein_coding / is_pseudo=false